MEPKYARPGVGKVNLMTFNVELDKCRKKSTPIWLKYIEMFQVHDDYLLDVRNDRWNCFKSK